MTLLGVDLGGSHATCSLISQNEVIASDHLELPDTRTFSAVHPSLTACLRNLAASAPTPVKGLGMGICALVDSRTNRVLSTNGKFEDTPDFDFESWSQAELGIPVRLENDARLALRGEMNAGAAQAIDDVVMFTLGTGIGGVAAMNGQPLVGRHGQAGVLAGHVPVRENGRRCTCGGLGCAEAEASGWALPLICKEWPGFEQSVLAHFPINFKSLFECSAMGDSVALQIRDHCLTIWSMMTVAAIHSFDPSLVVFGGGVMRAANEILPRLQQYVNENTWTPWGKVRLVRAALEGHAAALGVPTLFEEDSADV